MRSLLVICVLLALANGSAAAEKIEIWSYAFVTLKPSSPEPIAGDGASLFKPNNGWLEGPMNGQNGSRYKIRFAVSGKSVTAVLTMEKGVAPEIKLDGSDWPALTGPDVK